MSTIIVGGRALSVSHLAPTMLACPCAAFGRAIAIEVQFSNHCYTRSFDAAADAVDDILVREEHRVGRVFDESRYALSHGLPALMAALPAAKVHQSTVKRNYLYATLTRLPPMQGAERAATYQTFFTLRRAAAGSGHDLRLFVESAYALDGPPLVAKRPSAIRFSILALKVAKGQSVKFAAR